MGKVKLMERATPFNNRNIEEIAEVLKSDADAGTKCKMISNILAAKPHYFEDANKDSKDAFVASPIINGDEIYESLEYIRAVYKTEIAKRIGLYKSRPMEKWINITYNKDTEAYLLSPRPNPEDFVEKLKQDNLSKMYRDFLDEVGAALKLPETQTVDIEADQIQI